VQQGRYEDAIRQYEVLHEHRPHLDLAANNLAMLLVTYRKDQASLDRARELAAPFADSDVGALLDTHGWVLFKRGEVLAALSSLQRASAAAPDSKVILYHLGMAQLRAGQPDKARASLEAALAEGASFTGTDEARLALTQLKQPSG
jgi:tetratricopeptide (TPR) repeat protein